MIPPKEEGRPAKDGLKTRCKGSLSSPVEKILLVDSEGLAFRLQPDLLGATVLFVDPERLGHPLYRDEIVKQCGEGLPVFAPVDMIQIYRGDALAGLPLGARLSSVPLTVAEIEGNPEAAGGILGAAVKRMAADDTEANLAIKEMCEAGGKAAGVEAPPLDKLLDRIANFISSYVFFAKKAQLHAVTLWAFHTHVIDQFEVTPYLHAGSAEKRSGKTRLYEVLVLLVRNPWHAINPSEAVFYRKIEAHNPTMLLDEVDAIWNHTTASQHEGLRAGINAGYRRGVTVDRCAGQKGDKLVSFPVFCAKSLAGIGKLPDTIADRSIPIAMVRKTKQEEVKRFRSRDAKKAAAPIHADIVACAQELKFPSYPEMPEGLSDRAEEVWEPLIMIAEAAGGKWPELARKAALTLSADIEPEEDSLGIRLLADCRTVIDESGADRFPSKKLLNHLHDLEEAPWKDFEFTVRKLASMLKRYGVKSGTHRFEDKTAKGYLKTDFKDAWNRYSPLMSDSKSNIRNNGLTMRVSGQNQSVTEGEMLRIENAPNPADRTDVTDVTDKIPYKGAGGEEELPEPEQPTLTFDEETAVLEL